MESILNDVKKGTRDTTNASNETTSATNTGTTLLPITKNTTTTRSNDTYVYGVGIRAVLVIGVCVFFTYNTFQPKNNKIVSEKQDQLPKRRRIL